MNTLFTYFALGGAFMLSIDLFLMSKTFKKYAPKHQEGLRLRNQDRIIGILFWPICLAIFLVTFFKSAYQSYKNPHNKRKTNRGNPSKSKKK
jgi:hypothetical protein